jgi:hypothetical protein
MAANIDNVIKTLAPNSLTGLNVEEGMRIKMVQKKLQMESILDDIFEDLGADVVSSGESIAIPNAIFLKLDAVTKGTHTITVPLLMKLSGAPHLGPGTPIGHELKQTLKYATFYYDEYSQAVASENFGRVANEFGVYGVFEMIQPELSIYMKELHGKRIREALLETFDSVITDATGSTVSGFLNKNWFVPNTDTASQPAYDSVLGDFDENIADVLELAADTADGVNANISLDYLLALEYYAPNILKIQPIDIGGKTSYAVLVPSTQMFRLRTNEKGQLGDIYTGMVRSSEDEMKYTGVVGRVGKLLIIEDQRYPTIEITGADGSWAITPTYLEPGDDDSRNKAVYESTSNKQWDIGFLLGKAAVAEWEVTPIHMQYENQHYDHDKGTGAFGEGGICLVQYDLDADSQTDSTKENYGSIVLPFTTPAISA